MVKLTNEQLINKGFEYIRLERYDKAIRLFYNILKTHPNEKFKISAYLGLGNALRAEYEIELAEKMYKNAMNLAELIEDIKMIKLLDDKIENIYIFKKDRDLNPIQIGFFMRAIMKLLSLFGKKDWF